MTNNGEVLGTNEQTHEAVYMAIRAAFYRKCSECGATIINTLSHVFLDYDIRDLHYCPNCGAKMDEVNDGK